MAAGTRCLLPSGGLPKNFRRFLYGVGLFGTGDFAHSLMTLLCTRGLDSEVRCSACGHNQRRYALHNIVYAGISYPAGALADRINKRVLLALGYSIGVARALILALNINSVSSLAIALFSAAHVGWLWAAFGARVGFGFAVVLMTIGVVAIRTMRHRA